MTCCTHRCGEKADCSPFWVLQGVVQPGLWHRAQALHVGLDLIELRIWQIDEGVAIHRVDDVPGALCIVPLSIHCTAYAGLAAILQTRPTQQLTVNGAHARSVPRTHISLPSLTQGWHYTLKRERLSHVAHRDSVPAPDWTPTYSKDQLSPRKKAICLQLCG